MKLLDKNNFKKGCQFILDIFMCVDEDLLNWYEKQKNEILIAKRIEWDNYGVWVENCPHKIDLSCVIAD